MELSIDDLHLFALNVGICRHNGDWNWKNVCSPFSRLYYVTEGSAKVETPEGICQLKAGYLYFIPAFMRHNDICDSLFTHYYIHIFEDPTLGRSILDEYELPMEVKADPTDLLLMKRLYYINPFLKVPESNPNAYDNHQTLINNYRKNLQRPFCDKAESRGILFILLSRFLKYGRPKIAVADDRIHGTLAFIRHNLSSRIDIGDLASRACMSKGHFIREFKKATGETPNVFITRLILERAQLSLITTNLPIKTIADELGYQDFSYFNRIFKKAMGVTPLQYRISHF
ncbi:MAG: helix-turn-helix transcriptional regulator [Bacteroidaceae bacterium]|nr:helix-turn-helix transcriptional regulator [Bacteroidaceae bacterium]